MQVKQTLGKLLEVEGGDVRFEFSTGVEDDLPWRVRDVALHESLSSGYRCELTVAVHQEYCWTPELLGQTATLEWDRNGGGMRAVHGIVEQLREAGHDGEERLMQLSVVPAMMAAQHRSNSRIFEGKTAVQVAIQVLKENLMPFRRELEARLDSMAYPVREYIVQHRERDLHFAQRLLAEEGVWFFFEHPDKSLAAELLVLVDKNERCEAFQHDALRLTDTVQATLWHEAVLSLLPEKRMRPTRVSVRQFNWGNPDLPDEADAAHEDAAVQLALYEPDDVGVEREGNRGPIHSPNPQAQRRLQAHTYDRRTLRMATAYVGLRPGVIVTLDDHDDMKLNQDYLVVDVSHRAEAQRRGRRTADVSSYDNQVTVIPASVPYRPRRMDKPRIHGLQTATVVGADRATGVRSDVHTDGHGRIRVKFSWDRTRPDAEGTVSCWMRVAQVWGGPGWGGQFIPRIGMEVLVSFVDGDPDRPVVTGSVYNGRNPTALNDPAHSGLRTSSVPNGDGFNELRFEDASGNERIYVRAQKNMVEEVLNDHKTDVKANQSNSIGKSHSVSVGGDRSVRVSGNESYTVRGGRETTVTKKNVETYEATHEVTVTDNVSETYNAGHIRTVTGNQELECEADKVERISGRYELTTEQKYNLTQGGTSLTFEGNKVALDAAGTISIKRGQATVDIDDAGNIDFATSGNLSLSGGGSKIVLSAQGIEMEGLQVSATAGASSMALTPASAEMKSVNTTVEGSAVCSIKGNAMLGLN